MAMTASRDENYMLTLGGIMAGLVPAREGLSPGIIAKSLLHTPGFWMDVWDIRRERPLTDLASGMVSLAAWQARSLRTLTRDPAWSVRWATEILRKQIGVAAALGTAAGGERWKLPATTPADAGRQHTERTARR
jgi:hypothetical protein